MASPAPRTDDLPQTELNYMKPAATVTRFLGMPKCRMNCCIPLRQIKAMVGIGLVTEKKHVPLHSARAANLQYEKVGFTLQPLTTAVTDWDELASDGSSAQAMLYKKELESVIRKLHPTVKQVEWSTFLVRGGTSTNGPASGGIHLDYFPDKDKIQEFLARTGGGEDSMEAGFNDFRQSINKHPDLELGLILGLWKPRNVRTPVLESPLIMCDPATVDMKDAVPQEQVFTVAAEGNAAIKVVNLAANLKYSDAHRWYYYPEQTADEVTVFRHYTAANYAFANFHCAAQLPLPQGMEKRSSVETRAFLFF